MTSVRSYAARQRCPLFERITGIPLESRCIASIPIPGTNPIFEDKLITLRPPSPGSTPDPVCYSATAQKTWLTTYKQL